ncbi:Arm DNA-binding domain-containing protein [Rheinheimera hassiensis]|uniref:Arm DNA-binding domain-containing protein n=1 Tax=Rheinheimera hassiensis TaxID=1193627 RepID=UPI001F06DC38|nr:Arm DNA-binding domain-containing protein [Rheinheimera hassiensis]
MNLTTTFPFTEKQRLALKALAKKCQYSDEKLSNLKLIVTPADIKTYYVALEVKGKTHTIKLGSLEELALDDAKARAVEFIAGADHLYSSNEKAPDIT